MEKMMKKIEHLDPSERDKLRKMLSEKEGHAILVHIGLHPFMCFPFSEDDSKVDWMYKADQPDEEEYLLGRRVDQFIEDKSGTQDDLKGFT
jgi:hypothetical protein